MDVDLSIHFNVEELGEREIMSCMISQKCTLREGDIFFSEKVIFRVWKQGFEKKSVYGYNVMMKNRVYTKIRLVGKTVFQYVLHGMLNNQKY